MEAAQDYDVIVIGSGIGGLAAGGGRRQIAGGLGRSEATGKFHRAHLMEHMRADTVAELMYLAARLTL